MKFQKISIYFLSLLIVGISISSCDLFQERDRTYQGSPQVEFYPLNPAPIESDGSVTIKAQLIGAQRNSDLALSVSVVDSLTTAPDNVYTLSSTSVTIPADSSSAEFTFNVTNSNITDGKTKVLTLELQGTDEVKAAPNLNKSTITIRPPSSE